MIEKIDIHITDHCNLNCVSCTHFSPLAEEFYLDIDIFDRDLKNEEVIMNEYEVLHTGNISLADGRFVKKSGDTMTG